MMRKMLALLASLALTLALAGVALGADGASDGSGQVLLSVNGDVDVVAGETVDNVVVISGDAQIAGTANTVFVADGTVTTSSGSTLDSLVVINGTANLAPGTTIRNDVSQLNSTINGADAITLGGSVRDLAGDAAAFGLFIGATWILLWIGAALATILLGLLVAGLAARQLRLATGVISREPAKTFLVGLLAMIVPPVLAVLAFLTLVGIPAGIALLLFVWPAAAFAGYMVAAIWIGDWLLGRLNPTAAAAPRPYLAVVLGLIVAFVIGFIPFVTAVISVFGLGSVVLVAWRTLRGGTATAGFVSQPAPAG
jgi:hypothetical protein